MKKILMIGLVLTALLACSDDDGSFNLQVNMVSGDEELVLGQNIDINGVTVNLDIAQFYLAGVTLDDEDDVISYADQYHIFSPTDEKNNYGDVEIDKTFDILKFFVGVEPSVNGQEEMDFTSRSTSDPLGPKDPQMHWNWNTGYKFVRLDGNVDLDDDGVAETQFRYHIGTDNLLRNVEVPIDFNFRDGINDVVIEFDLEKLFEGIDLKVDYFTMTGDNPPPAIAAANNLPNAFSKG